MAGNEQGKADVGEGRMAASEGANGGDYADEGQDRRGGDTELFSKSLKIQSKRFYVDVKQNRRGKFIKIAEVSVNRSGKSKVIFTMGVARDFCTKLTAFANFLAQAPKRDEESEESGDLMNLGLKYPKQKPSNAVKGNIEALAAINQTGTYGRGGRTNIAVPAQGIVDIRNALSEVLEQYGSDEEEVTSDLPASREQRVEQKRFYFDVGSNARGVYLRISEVTANYRNSITIPKRGWTSIRDIIDDFVKKMEGDDDREEDEEEEDEEERAD
ncbi:unnamed protein product [Porites evermanni]|uniref:Transcriptional activator protein Pur-alpha n=1 Tax=Porites evermanni TaxID=104178 RepID=A0ABN8M3T3_9CNID|nr:unnamed protein product [Porites evermanni]